MRVIHFGMKNKNAFYCFLILLLGIGSTNGQESKSEFHKTVESINAILKANPFAYYTDNKQNSAFIKKISANELGIITFTDSIPNPEREEKGTRSRLLSCKNITNVEFVCHNKMGYSISKRLFKRQKQPNLLSDYRPSKRRFIQIERTV